MREKLRECLFSPCQSELHKIRMTISLSLQRMEMEGARSSRRDMSPAGRVRASGIGRERVSCVDNQIKTDMNLIQI